MRSRKASLADLKSLSEAAARVREKAEALAKAQAASNVPAPLPEVDGNLFARATRFVQPLDKSKARLLHNSTTTKPEIEQLAERRQRALGAMQRGVQPISDGAELVNSTDIELDWAAAGIGPGVRRQLSRAFWPIGARLDLHGLNTEAARSALLTFIEASQRHGTRCVCIIHGVGYGSANGQAVLPTRVRQWLKQLPDVSAFAQAPRAHGGAGAVLVLIRQP
jgi:hypothetical protein